MMYKVNDYQPFFNYKLMLRKCKKDCHSRVFSGLPALPTGRQAVGRESRIIRYPIKAFGYDKFTLLVTVQTVRNISYKLFYCLGWPLTGFNPRASMVGAGSILQYHAIA
jgi:hypothetical protein